MFDIFRNNKRIVQVILAILILPFALWGLDSYVRDGGRANEVAKVGKTAITLEEFQRALNEQQERLRPQLGQNLALLESPEFRAGVLNELINQRLLLIHAEKSGMVLDDATLSGFIASLPPLQVDGKFSRERYEALVAAQNMSIAQFESMLRRDLMIQQVSLPIAEMAVAGSLAADRWLMAQLEEREISQVVFRAEQFATDRKPDEAAIQRYYQENRGRFEQPEQVRVEFLVLSQDRLMETLVVSDEEIRAAYERNPARYRKPEQRRASHILIRVDGNAPAAEVDAAQTRAEQILARLRDKPAEFAGLAKQYSQDPGSAAQGGDLGFFGRGMMVKPFEDAAFSLQENQLSGLVRSDFGFHVIKLTGIRAEQAQKLEEVRSQILAELRLQTATKRYAEAAEGFSNLVYEQADSLAPAAEKYGLKIQDSDWLARGAQPQPPLGHADLLKAIFSEDAIQHRRNTEAIEVGPKTLISARVVAHKPSALLPLDQVVGVIEKTLMGEAALAQAVATGQAELDRLNRGEKPALNWSAPRWVSRMQAQDLGEEALKAVFAADPSKLPAYAGIRTASGYALYRIGQVTPFDPATPAAAPLAQLLRQQYGQILAREDIVNWLATLRQTYGVEINRAALERE
ncbi:MAG: SurA N-terminal domain-containing protein [Sulfuritalea sp.]|nr:SurA N-terminal domain-containing protein [Sulfuritalea sp.]